LTCSDAEESQAALWEYEAAFHYVQLLSAFAFFDDGAGALSFRNRWVCGDAGARSSVDRGVEEGESVGGGAGVETEGVAEVEGEDAGEVFGGTAEFVEGRCGASQFLAAAVLRFQCMEPEEAN
jgi:hypothetical protein